MKGFPRKEWKGFQSKRRSGSSRGLEPISSILVRVMEEWQRSAERALDAEGVPERDEFWWQSVAGSDPPPTGK